MSTPTLPDHLVSIGIAAVEHVHGNSPIPKDFSKLKKWIEVDGGDDLTASWIDERVALKLDGGLSGYLCDSELMEYQGLEDSQEISNETRVAYGRERIREWANGDDGYQVPSVHSYQVIGLDGKSAVLGYLVEIHGQGGAASVYCGLFTDNEAFFSHLRGYGLVLNDEVDDLSDASILELWEWPQVKGKAKARKKK